LKLAFQLTFAFLYSHRIIVWFVLLSKYLLYLIY